MTHMCCFVAIFLTICAGPSAAADSAAITFVHVNDLDRIEAVDGVGGLAKAVAVAKAEKAKGGVVLFTHGGDAISPSLLSAFDQGAHMIDLLNQAGLDAFALGNHEFDFGPDVLAERIGEADFPILAANVFGADGAPLPGLVDHLTFAVDGFKIALFGLTTATTMTKSSPAPARIVDPLPAAARAAAALRADGADVVVALAHTNRREDAALLAQGAVDVVLSGDDHDLRAQHAGGRLLIESASQGDHIAIVTLSLARGDRRDGMRVDLLPSVRFVDSATIDPDPQIAPAVARYRDALSTELDVPIGVTLTALDSRRPTLRGGEAAIGNLIADAMRAATEADAALTNGGGVRANRRYDPGTTLTRRHIQSELPFGNRTVVLDVDGATLRAALEHGLRRAPRPSGGFPQVSNIALTYDTSAPPGRRLAAVAVAGAPLDDDRRYRLATNDFLAGGGDGYAMLRDAPRIIDENAGGLIAAQVIAFIEAADALAPRVEGRITSR